MIDRHGPLATAILETLAYADIFDFPLTAEEIQRYLIAVRASNSEIQAALDQLATWHRAIECVGPFFTLPGRGGVVAGRLRLHKQAAQQMPRARWYGRLLGHLPFVRMVALTGGLSMENARDHDIDLLIVSVPGRLWTVRGMAVALVYLARLRGDQLCPNFLIDENRLLLENEDLYSAHEIVQMIPLYGLNVYRKFRELNCWADRFLPNAPRRAYDAAIEPALNPLGRLLKRFAEALLSTGVGSALEEWERNHKIKKLSAQVPSNADDVEFSRDACRGFFSGHAHRVLDDFEQRTGTLRPDWSEMQAAREMAEV
jgi:hypothetical protein